MTGNEINFGREESLARTQRHRGAVRKCGADVESGGAKPGAPRALPKPSLAGSCDALLTSQLHVSASWVLSTILQMTKI